MQTYRHHASWEKYKALLRDEFDFHFDREPTETQSVLLGHKVHIDEWCANGDTGAGHRLGTVIIVHGGGGNGRVLAPFAQSISKLGWRVLAPDLPGFGLTQPAQNWRAHYSAWPALIAALADRQDEPIVLVGASMGGLTAVFAAQDMHRPPRAVIATTLLDLSEPRAFVKAARWRAFGHLSLFCSRYLAWFMDRLSLPLYLAAPLHAMSSNKPVADYFRNDPLLGKRWVPLRFWRTAHGYRLEKLDLPCPLTLIHPGQDKWTAPEESLRTFEKITSEKRYVLLSNGSHLPVEPEAFSSLMDEISTSLEQVAH